MKRLLLVSLALLSLPALAQREGASERKVTVIDFDNDVIEGSLSTPDIEVQEGKGRVSHASVLKIRREFRVRVLGSAHRL